MSSISRSKTNYEIVIKLFESGNVIDRVMNICSINGVRIVCLQQMYVSGERQEIKVVITAGDSKQLNELEYDLKTVMNVESIAINRMYR